MAAIEELGAQLQSLQALKPPGVTKSKIDAITAKCVENVQLDSAIIEKIVQQYKSSAATHKLGVIYVVDSVTRQWAEKARAAGQAVSKNAAPGTFASGVQKVTDALPSLMSDLIQTAPEGQKEKISKLLDIWERSQTFPSHMLAEFKQQLKSPKKDTYTPPGSPPKSVFAPFGTTAATNQHPAPAPAPAPVASHADPGSLLAALAKMPLNGQANPPPAAAPVAYTQAVAPPPPPASFPPPPVVPTPQAFQPQPTISNEAVQQILMAIATGVIPQDQAMSVLAAVAQAQQAQQTQQPQQQPVAAPTFPPPQQVAIPPTAAPIVGPNGAHLDRYDQGDHRYRDRSRSPEYDRRGHSPNRRSPVNRRDSPTYGVYDPNARADSSGQTRNERERGRGRGRNKGRGRDDYRQRTPPGQRRQPSPGPNAPRNGPQQPKFIEWDNTLPRDHIRVLSRTLFVGGAGGTEGEIRNIFSRFGKVQTCIVNQEKRHAFVKMVNRHDAVAAKDGMDKLQDPAALSKARQTRWGVGFGPRDCSDYNTGISVIPIARLTDADRKWVVTAEFGGTGGLPLESGMVIEEPDIEIGAGVSSKAISRRVPPDTGGRRGGHGARGGYDHGSRFRKQDRPPQPHEPRHVSPRPEPSVGVPPAVPGFGFQLPGF